MLFPDPLAPEIIRTAYVGRMAVDIDRMATRIARSEAPTEGAFSEDIPYGLRISNDCQRLEVDPTENKALILMMDLLAQDFPYTSIVSDLNEKGFRMRDGELWTRVAVFNMMPRLIEVGPRLFSTEDWKRRRERLSRLKNPEAS